MKINSKAVVKNVIVAFTLCLAGVASWALTEFRTPMFEAQVTSAHVG